MIFDFCGKRHFTQKVHKYYAKTKIEIHFADSRMTASVGSVFLSAEAGNLAPCVESGARQN